jgi:hypothetical protein
VEEIFGLPAHPLMVHAPLVLVPLIGLGTVAVAMRPSWRRRYGWLLLAATAVALVATQLAMSSGEELQQVVEALGVNVDRHVELADTTRVLVIVLFVGVLAMVLFDRFAHRRRSNAGGAGTDAPGWLPITSLALPVVVVAIAALSTVWMSRTGHEGAKLVWGATEMNGDGTDDD